jgi:Tol biopolymer transport system component
VRRRRGENGRIIFERPVGGGGGVSSVRADLFAVAADGSGLARVFRTELPESQAEWSPDGTRIVFTRARPSGAYEVYVANADGSRTRRLTRHRAFSIAPSWSPDGRRIAYATDKDGPEPRSEDDPPSQATGTTVASHGLDSAVDLSSTQSPLMALTLSGSHATAFPRCSPTGSHSGEYIRIDGTCVPEARWRSMSGRSTGSASAASSGLPSSPSVEPGRDIGASPDQSASHPWEQ